MPLDGTIGAVTKHLAETDKELREHRAALTALAETLQAITAKLAGFAARGELATAEAIANARTLRDRAWHLLRRHWIEGGAAPSADELQAVDGESGLPDRFETLLRAADAVVDRRAEGMEQLVALEQQRARAAETETLRRAAAEAAERARQAHELAVAEWQAAWRPAGIVPQDPAAMREWLAARKDVLKLKRDAEDAREREWALARRHDAAWAALATLLPAEAAAAGGQITALLRTADRLAGEREAARRAIDAAAERLKTAQENADKAQRDRDRAEQDLAEWRAGWVATIGALRLPVETPPADAQVALDLWSRIESAAGQWQIARQRVGDMARTIEAFAAQSAATARRAAPDLADQPPHEQVRQLTSRLGQAREAQSERRRLTTELKSVRERQATLSKQVDAAEDALAGLRALAQAEDDTALQAAIERAARHSALSREIEQRTAELRGQDDGRSRGELEAEAAGCDIDTLRDRIDAIDQRLSEIADRRTARALRRAEVEGALADMERGRDAAAAAQDMRDARAEIDDIAARYVRLRLAQMLLTAAIDRIRAQSQDPLLRRAGELFGALTEGRYCRLVTVDADGEALAIEAQRPDGTACPVDRLSEGTSDQLYLALRLAAIEEAARGAEALPLIADDLLAGFDDRRALAALRALSEFGRTTTQVILFTHHAHIADMASPDLASVHRLGIREAGQSAREYPSAA